MFILLIVSITFFVIVKRCLTKAYLSQYEYIREQNIKLIRNYGDSKEFQYILYKHTTKKNNLSDRLKSRLFKEHRCSQVNQE